MMSRTLVSGQAGVAILFDECGIRSFHRHGPAGVLRSQAEVPGLVGGCKDVVVVEGLDAEGVPALLEHEWMKQRALLLFLLLIDSESRTETRLVAIPDLELFLAEPRVTVSVLHRMFAAPIPAEADLPGAIDLASGRNALQVMRLLVEIQSHQAEIAVVRSLWDAVPAGLFGSIEEKERVAFQLVTDGVLYQLAIRDANVKDTVFADLLENPRWAAAQAGIEAWRSASWHHWPRPRWRAASM
ncbi:MAG: hypothetical protein U0Q16_28430 [Bryobacteraceae bacterium]